MTKTIVGLAVLALAPLGMVGPPDEPVISNGPPLLWYDFEDSNDPTFNFGSLGVAYAGQLNGDASFGPYGGQIAIYLDGDGDYVLPLGTESAFDIGDSNFSVFARITTDHTSANCGDSERGAVWKERVGGAAGTPGYTFGVIKATGLLRLSLFDGSGPGESVVGGTPVNDGLPHEILGVKRGQSLELYVDRQLDASQALSGTLGSTDNNQFLVVGGRTLTGAGCTFEDDFDGSIDEVRVYDEAVAPGRIPEPIPALPTLGYVFLGCAMGLAGLALSRRRMAPAATT